MQSPIVLVPKAGNKTRLIFHLSFQFCDGKGSVNSCTPKELCTVKYNDLDAAVTACLRIWNFAQDSGLSQVIFMGKTDLSSAFRVLPLKKGCYCWLIMKTVNPEMGETKYFVEKCLPFGASISCSHYQRFSNAIKHIMLFRMGLKNPGRDITNYLDDFLFLALTKLICDDMIAKFMDLCAEINLSVAIEKTEWADMLIVFLGILLDRHNLVLSLPREKQAKALKLLNGIMDKKRARFERPPDFNWIFEFSD